MAMLARFAMAVLLLLGWLAPNVMAANLPMADIENSTDAPQHLWPDTVFDEVYQEGKVANLSVDTLPALPLKVVEELPHEPFSIYELPYSAKGTLHDWKHLWYNTAALAGAFVGTLAVLECLPEDATAWNRAELQDVPLGRRWKNHVITLGPQWDHDHFVFDYILHPYAGSVYYMAARSCGFNQWQSLLYCTIISNVGWEFGIEAFMERPSYQDMLITPLVGAAMGESAYRLKRHIVNHGYTLFNSSALGHIVAFFIDPVNEFMGLFTGNPAQQVAKRKKAAGTQMSLTPSLTPHLRGLSFVAIF